MEADTRKREAEIIRNVQAATMEREAKTIEKVTQEQIQEKIEIFNTYLPD